MSNQNTALKDKLAGKAGALSTGKDVPKTAADSVKDFLIKHKDELAMALPQHVTIDRLSTLAISTIRRTPLLASCSMQSLVSAFVISSQLGLEVNTPLGHAWMIPYKRKMKKGNNWVSIDEAQFQLGYQGLIDLAYRTGLYRDIYAEEVYKNDPFEIKLGLNRDLIHEQPSSGDRGELIGIYAVFHMTNGGEGFKYWTVEKIMAHAKRYSKSWDDHKGEFRKGSAWADNFDGMAKVPVIKDLLKLAPKSIEFQKQITLDGSTKGEFAADMADALELEDHTFEMGPESFSVDENAAQDEAEQKEEKTEEKKELPPESADTKTETTEADKKGEGGSSLFGKK